MKQSAIIRLLAILMISAVTITILPPQLSTARTTTTAFNMKTKVQILKAASKGLTSERTTSGQTASTQTRPEQATSEQTTSEQTASEQTISEQTASTQTATETMTEEHTTQMTTQEDFRNQIMLYEESTTKINNPDQGFYQHIVLHVNTNGIDNISSIRKSITEDVQLYHLRINIGAFTKANNQTADLELTQAALDGIDEILNTLYRRGKNAIVRMAYTYDEVTDTEPQNITMIKKHIEQISPILNQYPDTITAIEVGLIGPWGEMHSSHYANKASINALIESYLSNTEQFPVLVRTPSMIYDYLGISYDAIGGYTISSDSETYRLGIFNDGYLGSSTDLGTYTDRSTEIPWLAKQTSHLPYGGEVAAPLSNLHSITNCAPEMYQMHLSYLNKTWNDTVIDHWKTAKYTQTAGTDSLYYGKSVYEYIENHLGYRFVLTDSDIEYSDESQTLNIQCNIKNTGFGNLNRTKQVTILLVDEYGHTTTLSNTDTFNGIISLEQGTITIHSPHLILADENYKIYLRIDNGGNRYPIQFANNDLWNNEFNANLVGFIKKEYK